MSTIGTSSFEPLLPEDVEDRWIDYYTGLETSPYCTRSAVSLPFAVGQRIPPSPTCPPGTTPSEAALMLMSGFETDSADTTEPPARP
jgi:hypothetical protein